MAKNYFSLYTYYVILLLFYYIIPFVTSLFYLVEFRIFTSHVLNNWLSPKSLFSKFGPIKFRYMKLEASSVAVNLSPLIFQSTKLYNGKMTSRDLSNKRRYTFIFPLNSSSIV